MKVFQIMLRKGPAGLWDRIKGRLFNHTAPEKISITRSNIKANTIIVYQMGRVGSNSIKESLEQAYRSRAANTKVLHGHYLNNFEELEKRAKTDLENPTNFIEGINSTARALRQSMMKMHEDQRLKLISLVRDPVARNVSTFCFALNGFLPGWEKKVAEHALTIDELHRIFLSKRAYVLTAFYWFEEQMEPVFDIDVYATPFPRERGYQIYSSSKADLLLLRLESLDHCAKEAFHEFLGLPDFKLSNINRGDDLKTGELYRLFKKKPLPYDYIEWTYSFRLARHFYTEEELRRFAATWAQNERETNKEPASF
jgi:hypothetical protein